MNTLIIATFTSLLSFNVVAEPVAAAPLSTETFSSGTLAAEIKTDIAQYTTQLPTETAQQAHQALFSTGVSLLSLNKLQQGAKQDMEYLVQHMVILAKKLAASAIHAE
jgi:hypothetical protein